MPTVVELEDEEVLPTEQGFAHIHRPDGAEISHTPEAAIHAAHAKAEETFRSGRTKSYEWREKQLKAIRQMVTDSSDQILAAVGGDLGRPVMENFLAEVSAVCGEVDFVLANLKSWMQPQAVSTPLLQQPGRSAVLREPKGVVLILCPWNFPINLSLMGMVNVIAAGNAVVLKPSEIARNSEILMSEMIPRYLDTDAIHIITGGVPETQLALHLRWDHIFYTGSGPVGRLVLKAAAEHLTPCTLELGGKCPTMVLPGAKIAQAAKRILSTKCFNCGQICISPDYILVHEDVEEELIREMTGVLKAWLGEDASKAQYGRIINTAHFNRIKSLLDSTDGEVLPYQGELNEATKFIPPIMVRNPSKTCKLMTQEIFGPMLPILTMKSLDSMVEHVNAGEKPLAMYIFGSEANADQIISRTSSGGVCVNDTMMHMVSPELPFGGVGGSGMGRYHGKWGFDEFSHLRAVMYRATWADLPQRYRPFTDTNQKIFEKIMIGPLIPEGLKKAILAAGGAALAGAGLMAARSRL